VPLLRGSLSRGGGRALSLLNLDVRGRSPEVSVKSLKSLLLTEVLVPERPVTERTERLLGERSLTSRSRPIMSVLDFEKSAKRKMRSEKATLEPISRENSGNSRKEFSP
jgi:hypothetical protein